MANSSTQGGLSTVTGNVDVQNQSSDTTITNNNNQQQQATTSGNVAGASSLTATSLSNSTGNNISYTQESPQAIAALSSVANQALNSIATVGLGSIAQGNSAAQNALDTAKHALESQTQQATPLIIGALVIAAVVVGFIYYSKR